jgi:hypothetical protein
MKTSLPRTPDYLVRQSDPKTPNAAHRNQSDEWARQLAAMLNGAEMPTPPLPPQHDTSANAPAQRALTPPQFVTQPTLVGAQNSDATGDNRLTLNVCTPELGDVAIIIDRTEGGVRVVLGVGGQQAAAALDPQKLALIQSLKRVGLDVDSVSVVQQSRLGTVLAPAAGTRESSGPSPHGDPGSATSRTRKSHKRFSLIG